MPRKSTKSVSKKGNVPKADSYREAWARIELAQKDGFYIEVASIVESILSDRLLSYLHGAHKFPLRNKKGWNWSFKKLLDEVDPGLRPLRG